MPQFGLVANTSMWLSIIVAATVCCTAAAAVEAAAAAVKGPSQTHKCQHTIRSSESTIIRRDIRARKGHGVRAPERREAASLEYQDPLLQPWRAMKITAEFGFADEPGTDVHQPPVDGVDGRRACVISGQLVQIGGSGPFENECVDGRTTSCWLRCRDEDVLTPSARERLETEVLAATRRFGAMLLVQSDDEPEVDVRNDPLADPSSCDGIDVPPRTVTDSHYVLFVTVRPLHHHDGLLAYALACAADVITGRPYMGTMNIPPSVITSNDNLGDVILHEMIHALGFSPNLLESFRHPADISRTYFEYDPGAFPTGPVRGDGIVVSDPAAGAFHVDYSLLGPGRRLEFIGPHAVAHARSYFACDSISGVEWENGGGNPGSTASHWEKRLLFEELMSASQNYGDGGALSNFTAAAFADMGWYRVNHTSFEADEMGWGRAEGCAWARGCTSSGGKDGHWRPHYFCEIPRAEMRSQCTFDRRRIGICNVATFATELPPAYQHFPDDPTQGGLDELADRCPLVEAALGGSCQDHNDASVHSINAAFFFERRGGSSRCFETSAINHLFEPPARPHARCYETVCISPAHATSASQRVVVGINGTYYECADNRTIGLQVPPRSQFAALTFDPTEVDEVYISDKVAGKFGCGSGLSALCAAAVEPGAVENAGGSEISARLLRIPEWPTITAVSGLHGGGDGRVAVSGDTITVRGRFLSQCNHSVRLAGAEVANVSVVLDEASQEMVLVGESGAFDGTGTAGGANNDGTGNVTVELTCVIPHACPNGCVAATAAGAVRLVAAATAAPIPEDPSTAEGSISTTPAQTSPAPASGSAQPAETPTTSAAAGPDPSSSEPTSTEVPAPQPHSVVFVLRPDVHPDNFVSALRDLLGVEASDVILIRAYTQPTTSNVEVELAFASEALRDSGLRLTDSEKDALGVLSATPGGDPGDGGDGGGGGGSSWDDVFSSNIVIGIGVGITIICGAAFLIMRYRNNEHRYDRSRRRGGDASELDVPMVGYPLSAQHHPQPPTQPTLRHYGREEFL